MFVPTRRSPKLLAYGSCRLVFPLLSQRAALLSSLGIWQISEYPTHRARRCSH